MWFYNRQVGVIRVMFQAIFSFMFIMVVVLSYGCYSSSSEKKGRKEELIEFISNQESRVGGKIGVYALNLLTGEEIGYNEAEPFPTASAIKLPVLLTFLKKVQEGQLDLNAEVILENSDKVGGSGILQFLTDDYRFKLFDLAKLMIILSDNTATNLVIESLGGTHEEQLRAVNDFLQERGFARTRLLNKVFSWDTKRDTPESIRYGLGVSTPAEMGRLMEMLVKGELLDSVHTSLAMKILGAQFYNQLIPAFLPLDSKGIRVYHKTGGVTESLIDVGYVESDSVKYVLALFVDQFLDHSRGEHNQARLALAKISRHIWNYFSGDEGMRSGPYYSQDYYPYPGGTWYRLRLKNAPFPHPARKEGHYYKGKFYSADRHYKDSSAVVIVPVGFHEVGGKIDFLVHFHGWFNDALSAMGKYRIPQQLKASGKNAIVVIVQGPYRAPDSFIGHLEEPGGFTRMVREILEKLHCEGVIESKEPGRIILSAHSGGYRAVARILQNGDLRDNIKEIFLFDAFYALQESFLDFARRGGIIRSVYTEHLRPEHERFFQELDAIGLQFSREWEPLSRLVFYSTSLEHNQVMDGNLEKWLKASIFDYIVK